jgi:hypothetical protein
MSTTPKWSRDRVVAFITNALLGQFKVPGWLAIALAVFMGVADWNSRIEFWISVARSSNRYLGTIASVLLWPYFAPALAIAGFLYVLAVPGSRNAQRHPIVPIVAWISVALCIASVVITAGYGAIEIYIRQEVAKGLTGVPRGTPDALSGDQPPVYSNARQLSPNQIRLLLVELAKFKDIIHEVQIFSPPLDGEANAYVRQLLDTFQRSGIMVSTGISIPLGLDDVGISIRVQRPSEPSEKVQKLLEAFAVANISPRIVEWNNSVDIIYVGPRPML